VLAETVFDLFRRDVFAAANDQTLDAARDVDVAIGTVQATCLPAWSALMLCAA